MERELAKKAVNFIGNFNKEDQKELFFVLGTYLAMENGLDISQYVFEGIKSGVVVDSFQAEVQLMWLKSQIEDFLKFYK
jgi:hypothetical protein